MPVASSLRLVVMETILDKEGKVRGIVIMSASHFVFGDGGSSFSFDTKSLVRVVLIGDLSLREQTERTI